MCSMARSVIAASFALVVAASGQSYGNWPMHNLAGTENASGDDGAHVLMLLANARGGINSLMAEVLEEHIRLHLFSSKRSSAPPAATCRRHDRAKAYLK